MKNKAVILGSNYYIGLSVIRCLGRYDIETVAIDYSAENAYGSKSKYCTEHHVAPHYKNDKEAFIAFLIDYAKKEPMKPVLYPCHDSYVEVVDEYLDTLKPYYLISQQEMGLWTKLMGKDTLYALAIEHGMPVPETIKTDEVNYKEKISETVGYPCIVKPVDSPAFVATFNRKIFLVNDEKELTEAVEKANKAGLEVIVQRIIPGFDDHMHTYDAYLNQDSKVTHWLTCQKFRQYPINYGASVYTGQKYIPEMHEIGSRFFEAVGYKGFGEIEFKKDANTGQFYMIEINVRTTNLNSLLDKAELNFPYINYCEMTGNPLPPKAIEKETNLVFWYAYEDFYAVRGYVKTGQLTWGQVFKSYFKRKAYAVWSWDDMAPGLALWGIIFKKFFKRFKK